MLEGNEGKSSGDVGAAVAVQPMISCNYNNNNNNNSSNNSNINEGNMKMSIG